MQKLNKSSVYTLCNHILRNRDKVSWVERLKFKNFRRLDRVDLKITSFRAFLSHHAGEISEWYLLTALKPYIQIQLHKHFKVPLILATARASSHCPFPNSASTASLSIPGKRPSPKALIYFTRFWSEYWLHYGNWATWDAASALSELASNCRFCFILF